MNIPVNDDFGISSEDLTKLATFKKAVRLLSDIKLVRGGQALYGTFRKRKVLKSFLENYINDNFAAQLDDLEETIASMK